MNLSVHVLVRNGSRVVGRALRSLRGVADEVVLVDSGSTDGTMDVAGSFCELAEIAFRSVVVTPESHPYLFLLDEPSTWRRLVPGPFTGLRVLRRFDLARNLGLDLCRGKYVLKLDADDEVLDPAGVVVICRFLDANPTVDFVMCPYEVVGEDGEVVERVLYDRVWRNEPGVRFALPVHEYLLGKRDVGQSTNWALTTLGATRDHQDSTGEGSRVPHRNYKVFLAEYERRLQAGESLDERFLGSTVGEVEEVDPDLALDVRRMLRSGS